MNVIILIAALIIAWLVFNWLVKVIKTSFNTAIAIALLVLFLQLGLGIGPQELWEQFRHLYFELRQILARYLFILLNTINY
jgi:predicted Na+-dependent transporter